NLDDFSIIELDNHLRAAATVDDGTSVAEMGNNMTGGPDVIDTIHIGDNTGTFSTTSTDGDGDVLKVLRDIILLGQVPVLRIDNLRSSLLLRFAAITLAGGSLLLSSGLIVSLGGIR